MCAIVVKKGIVLECVSSSLIALACNDDGVITWEMLMLLLIIGWLNRSQK